MNRNEPAGANTTASIVDDRLAAVRAEGGVRETLQVEWREAPKSLPVITMPLSQLVYNPETHRVKAQRDYQADGDKAITSDPWGSQAQQYLDYLLSALPNDPSKLDPSFEKLRDDLKTYGQKEPGIITPSGILINGNSRCAALRRNGETHMRVAVLPSDWGWDDVNAVELELQMRKDYRRDYSFVNTLLALNEAIAAVGPDNAMKAFRMQKVSFNRSVWILQTLQDLVARSRTPGGESLNLRDFENDQGKLEELYRTYSTTQKTDPAAADLLLESRLLGLLLNKSKTDIRLVNEDFQSDYLDKHLAGSPFDGGTLAAAPNIPGLGRPASADAPALAKAKGLVNEAAQLRTLANGTDDSARYVAQNKLSKINTIVETALDAAGRNARLKKSQQAAIDRINDAADALDSAVREVADAKSKNALDEADLDEAVTNLRRSVAVFAGSLSRMATLPPASTEWLSELRTLKDD